MIRHHKYLPNIYNGEFVELELLRTFLLNTNGVENVKQYDSWTDVRFIVHWYLQTKEIVSVYMEITDKTLLHGVVPLSYDINTLRHSTFIFVKSLFLSKLSKSKIV